MCANLGKDTVFETEQMGGMKSPEWQATLANWTNYSKRMQSITIPSDEMNWQVCTPQESKTAKW